MFAEPIRGECKKVWLDLLPSRFAQTSTTIKSSNLYRDYQRNNQVAITNEACSVISYDAMSSYGSCGDSSSLRRLYGNKGLVRL